MNILVLNAGSSTLKSSLFTAPQNAAAATPPEPLWEAQVTFTDDMAQLDVRTGHGATHRASYAARNVAQAIGPMLATMWEGATRVVNGPGDIAMAGHRVVHGGATYRAATVIDHAVKHAIAQLASLAPTHNPANLAGIEALEQLLPGVTQIAIFDTAFHTALPDAAAVYPVPFEWTDLGIRRYGFHGISHGYCARRTAQMLGRDLTSLRIVTCHLGNGCSLAAIQGGVSIDTTMGFTPLEGLMMGTRSGSVDPALVFYLMREHHWGPHELEQVLNRESGLKGVSGISSDMREVAAAAAAGHRRAQLAIDIYVHRLRAACGAMVAVLGGLDALVFTAGVGENDAAVRGRLAAGMAFVGVEIDASINEHCLPDVDIATSSSPVRVLVIHTRENWAIAQECLALSGRGQ